MGLVRDECILATTHKTEVYGGWAFTHEDLERMAQALKTGTIPLQGDHDERLRIPARVINAGVRKHEDGHSQLWVEQEVEDDDWRRIEAPQWSVTLLAWFMEKPAENGKPHLSLASDPAHYSSETLRSALEILEPHFNVRYGHVLQFAILPPAKVIFDIFEAAGFLAIPGSVMASALSDAIKVFLAAHREKVTNREPPESPSELPVVVVMDRFTDGEVEHVTEMTIRSANPHLVDKALAQMPNILNKHGRFNYSDDSDGWEQLD